MINQWLFSFSKRIFNRSHSYPWKIRYQFWRDVFSPKKLSFKIKTCLIIVIKYKLWLNKKQTIFYRISGILKGRFLLTKIQVLRSKKPSKIDYLIYQKIRPIKLSNCQTLIKRLYPNWQQNFLTKKSSPKIKSKICFRKTTFN